MAFKKTNEGYWTTKDTLTQPKNMRFHTGIPWGFRWDSEGFRMGLQGFHGIPRGSKLCVFTHPGRPEFPLL